MQHVISSYIPVPNLRVEQILNRFQQTTSLYIKRVNIYLNRDYVDTLVPPPMIEIVPLANLILDYLNVDDSVIIYSDENNSVTGVSYTNKHLVFYPQLWSQTENAYVITDPSLSQFVDTQVDYIREYQAILGADINAELIDYNVDTIDEITENFRIALENKLSGF